MLSNNEGMRGTASRGFVLSVTAGQVTKANPEEDEQPRV